jgi:hypothetical protein
MSAQAQVVAGLARNSSTQRILKANKEKSLGETPRPTLPTRTADTSLANRPRMATPRNSIKKSLGPLSVNETKKGSPATQRAPTLSSKQLQQHSHGQDEERNTIPLGAVLHILRERRKDQLNFQCLVYLVFLLVYTAVANLHHQVVGTYSQNSGIREMLLNEPFNEPDDLRTYADVGELDEWWLWFEGPFASKIWESQWNNGEYKKTESLAVLLAEAYIVGNIQLRQVRSQSYQKVTGKRSFLAWYPYTNTTAMTTDHPIYGNYTAGGLSELNGMSYDIFTQINYGYGGYTYELPTHNATACLALIQTLKHQRWLDGGTRAVALDVNIYNPSSDVITAIRITTEFYNNGLILRQGWAFSARIRHYSTDAVDVLRATLEAIVVMFVLYYWFYELYDIYDSGGCFSFRFTLFNTLSHFNLVMIVAAIGIHLVFSYRFTFVANEHSYVDLYTPLEWWSFKKNLVGSTLLFGYLRLFRYLELNARIKVLIYAISQSAEDLVTTFFVLITCIVAFAVCGMLLFGENLQEFSAIGFSMSTLLRAMIGDFECYTELRYFHPGLAPVYYASYVFTVLLVVFNMMIAVIIDGYEEAKNIILHQKVDQDRAPFVYSRQKSFYLHIWLSVKSFFLQGTLSTVEVTASASQSISNVSMTKILARKKSKTTKMKMKQKNKLNQVAPADSAAAAIAAPTPMAGATSAEEKIEVNEVKDVNEVNNQNNKNNKNSTKKDWTAAAGVVQHRTSKRGSNTAAFSAVVHRLNQDLEGKHHQDIRLKHLVEHVKRANDTLQPAQELKDLFKGGVEKKFKHMYTRDTLSTHAIGDEALVKLNAHDLEGILGSKQKALRVLHLYHFLMNRKKLHNNFIKAQRRGSLTVPVFGGGGEMEERGVAGVAGGMAGVGGAGEEVEQESLPMAHQMALAINALNEKIHFIAEAMVEQRNTTSGSGSDEEQQQQSKLMKLKSFETPIIKIHDYTLDALNQELREEQWREEERVLGGREYPRSPGRSPARLPARSTRSPARSQGGRKALRANLT